MLCALKLHKNPVDFILCCVLGTQEHRKNSNICIEQEKTESASPLRKLSLQSLRLHYIGAQLHMTIDALVLTTILPF